MVKHRWAGGKAQLVPTGRTQSRLEGGRGAGGCTVWGRGAQAHEESPEITTKWKIKCTIHARHSSYPETIPLSFPTLSPVQKGWGLLVQGLVGQVKGLVFHSKCKEKLLNHFKQEKDKS